MSVFDDRVCALGEGPLWHPEREQLFWFDILGKRLLTRGSNGPAEWGFDEYVSAAGWIDRDRLLIASATGLALFDLATGKSDRIVDLEADNDKTRSNDARADPFGGFWIGTMGLNAERGAGAIYRFFKGTVERLYSDITISNAICFTPDKRTAFFADTPTRKVMRQPLDGKGWPKGKAEVFIDLAAERLNPDGAVVDAEGCLWLAQWGAGRVARYSTDGKFLSAVRFPASQISCPAIAGNTLFATSAADGLNEPDGGKTFAVDLNIDGQPEHRVIL